MALDTTQNNPWQMTLDPSFQSDIEGLGLNPNRMINKWLPRWSSRDSGEFQNMFGTPTATGGSLEPQTPFTSDMFRQLMDSGFNTNDIASNWYERLYGDMGPYNPGGGIVDEIPPGGVFPPSDPGGGGGGGGGGFGEFTGGFPTGGAQQLPGQIGVDPSLNPLLNLYQPPQQGNPMFGDFNDPFNMILSQIPVLEDFRDRQMYDAMSMAGMGGNRFSSGAQQRAGEIAGRTTLAMQDMMSRTLSDFANQQSNRSLQAAIAGGNMGGQIDQAYMDRLNELGDFGQFEQLREDNILTQLFQDFRNNQYGFLPDMLAAASGTPQPQVFPQTNPGSGLMGILSWLQSQG